VQIRATSDGADNNVDNGITTPVVATSGVVVSDGKLFSLTLTSPDSNAIRVNAVDGSVVPNGTLPVEPDGTYSLTVSALATDRQGNPVLPGTPIRFGAVDFPTFGFPEDGPGTFYLSGIDGNPQEGGTLFTAPTGHFTTAGGGAGPGDTLLVFGDLVPGNRDLEGASIVQSVNTATSLNVTVPFNRNDDTGASVNNGNVLPYVIGRATTGNIDPSAFTNDIGVASVKLNYPVSRLGKAVYLYAQGDGDSSVAIKKVTDIAEYVYPGVAPAKLTVSPDSIPGNATAHVRICLIDALNSPLQGIFITFGFHDLGVGSGKVDGISTSGTVDKATGADGCTIATVTTVGIATGGTGTPGVTFSALGQAEDVAITAAGSLILTASPSAFSGSGGLITLTLLDSSGAPVPGVQIKGTCVATGGATITIRPPGPGITNASGVTTTIVDAISLNNYGSSGSGSCTFTTATGAPTAIVTFTGKDLCAFAGSPDPHCPPSP
jgi:hypothetical protein